MARGVWLIRPDKALTLMEVLTRYSAAWPGVALAILLTIASLTPSHAVPATDRILERAIAQEEDWLVLQESGQGGCYLAQLIEPGTAQMQRIVRQDGVPLLRTPYRKGFKGYVVFKVDRRNPLFVAAALVENPQAFDLPKEILPDMFAGRNFSVWAQPVGNEPQEQKFSLVGFTAAMSWLERAECHIVETPDDAGGRETR